MKKTQLTDIENEFLSITPNKDKGYGFIRYIREYRNYTKSVTGAILLRAVIDWYKTKGSYFYKFKEPCSHSLYVEGDSWCEELGFTKHEFDGAIKEIGQKLKKGTKKNPNVFVWYWIDMDRLTHYQVNIKAVAQMTLELFPNLISKEAVNQYCGDTKIDFSVNRKTVFTESDISDLHDTIDYQQKLASTPSFSKNEILKNPSTKEPKTISLNDNHSILKTTTGAALKDKAKDPKELDIETNQNNNLKSTETVSESTNKLNALCLYSEVAKNVLNAYNETAKRKYSFKTWGDTIIKRLKAEFTKEQIQDPNTFELIKTMLEVKWSDTIPDQKGFAQLPIKNYEISTLFSPSKFKTYMQAAENTLTEKQNRKQKAAESKKTNIFDSII
jgi:hypothetical protein